MGSKQNTGTGGWLWAMCAGLALIASFYLAKSPSSTSPSFEMESRTPQTETESLPAKAPPLHLLYITLEFVDPMFSGNGVYSRSLVRGLLEYGAHVTVLCGRPENENVDPISGLERESLRVHTVPLPTWRRLDRQSAWKEFEERSEEVIRSMLLSAHYDAILGVDWTSAGPARHFLARRPNIPYIFMNFRVFSSHQDLVDNSHDDAHFYTVMERAAISLSQGVITLSSQDAEALMQLVSPGPAGTVPACAYHGMFHAVLPALRPDVHELASQALLQAQKPPRRYLTCCVRLSAEKNPGLFVDVVERIVPVLRKHKIAPLLCGAAADRNLAAEIKSRLRAAYEDVEIIEEFLGPARMAEIYSQSVVNFHPSLYDAYGMTIVEAAAFGTPSLVNNNDRVGAVQLLLPSNDEIFVGDLSVPENAAVAVTEILEDKNRLARVGERARVKALSYDQRAATICTVDILNKIFDRISSGDEDSNEISE